MVRRVSLRWFLIAGCLLIIWGVVVITTTSSYLSSQTVLLDHSKAIMRNIVDFATVEAQHYLNIANHSTRLTRRLLQSEVLGLENERLAQLEQYYLDTLETHEQFAGIYFADTQGGFFYVSRMGKDAPGSFRTKRIEQGVEGRKVTLQWRDSKHQLVKQKEDPADRYDPRKRPWYLKAASAGEPICTNPYIFFTSGKPGITIAEPVFNNEGQMIGVVGADIEIDKLSKFISQLKIGQHGSSLIISDNSKLVALPQMEKITEQENGRAKLVNIQEVDDPLSRKAFGAIDWGTTSDGRLLLENATFAEFEDQGAVYHAMFTRFPLHQWPLFIGVYVPENDYLGVIKENRAYNIIFALLVSVVATLIAIQLARSINRPLVNLAREAKAIENYDFETPFKTNSIYNEIDQTAVAFKHMKSALTRSSQDRDSAFDQLRESESQYRELFESAVEGLFQGIPNQGFTSVNPALAKMCGYDSPEDMCARKIQPNQLFPDLEIREQLIGPLMKGKEVRGFELQAMRKDGSLFWVSVSARPVIDDEGNFKYLEGSVSEISERKALEESQRESLKAQVANQAKSDFLANMSHEIRTPLNVIKGFTELAVENPDPAHREDYLGKIKTASSSLLNIVNDILDFSKIEAERLDLEDAPFELRRIFEKLDSLFGQRSANNDIRFSWAVAEEIPQYLVGDALRLEQVLVNLVDNAFKFTEQGEVRISVSRIRQRPGRNRLQFVIEDTGIGIPSAEIEELFNPFTQEDSSITRRFGGTGLGLAICKSLVTMMNGTLEAENREEGGSRFRFEACLGFISEAQISDQTDAVVVGNTHPDLSGCNILVVEDNKLTLELTRELIERVGATVSIARNGQEAVDSMAKCEPDLIVMDIQMPVMDGFEATQIIRSQREGNWLPIIAVSAHAVKGYRELCIRSGMDDYLTKPIDADLLYSTLVKWLRSGAANAGFSGKTKSLGLVPDVLEGIDTLTGRAQVSGNERLYRRILDEFVGNHASAPNEIEDLVNGGDRDGARLVAHAQKGVAAQIAAPALLAAAVVLEKALGSDKEIEEIIVPLRYFKRCHQQVLSSLGDLPDLPEIDKKSLHS